MKCIRSPVAEIWPFAYLVLHALLPPPSASQYNLRDRPHNRLLCQRASRLTDCNFIIRMLYSDMYWLTLRTFHGFVFVSHVEVRFGISLIKELIDWLIEGIWNPHFGGRGGRRGSAMAPFKRAMVVFYRLSIVTVAISVTIRPQFAIECLRRSNQQGVGHFEPKFLGVLLGVDPWCLGLPRANIPG